MPLTCHLQKMGQPPWCGWSTITAWHAEQPYFLISSRSCISPYEFSAGLPVYLWALALFLHQEPSCFHAAGTGSSCCCLLFSCSPMLVAQGPTITSGCRRSHQRDNSWAAAGFPGHPLNMWTLPSGQAEPPSGPWVVSEWREAVRSVLHIVS